MSEQQNLPRSGFTLIIRSHRFLIAFKEATGLFPSGAVSPTQPPAHTADVTGQVHPHPVPTAIALLAAVDPSQLGQDLAKLLRSHIFFLLFISLTDFW